MSLSGVLTPESPNLTSELGTDYVFNYNPRTTLAKWRAALAKVRLGTSDAKIMCCGDSTTFGKGSAADATTGTAGSYPRRLAQILNLNTLNPSFLGLAVTNTASSPDSRWAMGAGWSRYSGVGIGNISFYKTLSSAGDLVFTPTVASGPTITTDSFEIYVLHYSSQGTATITATGGTPVNVPSGLSASIVKYTAAPLARLSTNAVTITKTGAGNCWVLGIEPIDTTIKSVRVANAGVSSTQLVGSWDQSGNVYDSSDCIVAYAPDLTIISLGINDATAGTVTAAAYSTALQILITAAKTSGDVLLMSPYPSTGASILAFESAYGDVMRSLAITNNCIYFDLFNYFGATNPGTPFDSGDSVHPSSSGYYDIAQAISRYLI